MKTISKAILLGVALSVALNHSAHAVNSVVVESRIFSPNQPNCSVGVYLNNDIHLIALDVVLEVRSAAGEAYFFPPMLQSEFFFRQIGRRLDRSPLGGGYPGQNWEPSFTVVRFIDTFATASCSGPVSHTWAGNNSTLSGTSPDGIWYQAIALGDAEGLDIDFDPGADPHRRDSASWLFRFATNSSIGCFEIDTACYSPSKHLLFFNRNDQPVAVAFTKGIICIDSSCYHCYCLGNPHDCPRGSVDIVDVLQVINVAFRQQPAITDPSVVCPYSDTDLNCDGTTDVIDLTRLIQVAFGGQLLSDVVCDPCE